MHYQSNNGTFTKCVSSLLDWGSAALATAATAITSSFLSSPSTPVTATPKCCTASSAKQSLNPNAKEFVPLNPNAKEFTPAKNIPVPDPIQSPEPVSMRTVAQRKCTPWIPPGSSLGSFDDSELPRGEIS